MKVTNGAFINFEGEVDELIPDKGMVRIITTIFGRRARPWAAPDAPFDDRFRALGLGPGNDGQRRRIGQTGVLKRGWWRSVVVSGALRPL